MNRIEHEIIEYYKDFFKINKINVYSLKNQLKTGCIKVICRMDQANQETTIPNIKKSFILKISGIWETDTNIGITYKFQK
jgi:hypothetical protein